MIVLKLDADGALVYRDGTATHVPPASAPSVVDATGAGDSFAGAFLARLVGGADPNEAARFANQVSAWVIQHTGARPAPGPRLRPLLDGAD